MIGHALIAATPSGLYYVRRPDGEFDRLGVRRALLVSRIQELGMSDALDIWRRNKDGEVIGTKSAQHIMDAPTTTSVARVVRRRGARRCVIEDEGEPYATLVIPAPEDHVARFLADYTLQAGKVRLPSLHWAYLDWCSDRRDDRELIGDGAPLEWNQFLRALAQHGIRRRWWQLDVAKSRHELDVTWRDGAA